MKKTTKHVVASNAVHSQAEPATPSAPAHAPAEAGAAPALPPAVVPAPPPAVSAMADPAVKQCIALLNQVLVLLGGDQPLTPLEILHATKMRKGGAEVIPKILALCQQHGVTNIGSLTTQEMSDELDRGDALNQVGVKVALVQKKVKDGAMGAYGRSWQIGTTMYTTLQRLAVDDPELAVGLGPVQSFFQTKKTKGTVRKTRKQRAQKKLAQQAGEVAAPPAGATGDGNAGHAGGASAPPLEPAPAAPAVAPEKLNGQSH